MTDLSPESKTLVELARGDDEPTEADRARVRRALGASLATGIVVSSATSMAAGTGVKAAAGTVAGGLLKIAMWVGIGMAVGAASMGAVWVATKEPAATPAPASRPPTHAHAADVRAAPVPETIATEVVPATTDTIPLEVTAKPSSARAPQPSASSLTEEMRLLETARAALSGGDARRALGLLEQHEREFPAGALAEERRASKVFALCELGRRGEAARAATEFLRTAPVSPLRRRVLDSCAFSE